MDVVRSAFSHFGGSLYVVRSHLRDKFLTCTANERKTTVSHVPSYLHRFYKNCGIRTCRGYFRV